MVWVTLRRGNLLAESQRLKYGTGTKEETEGEEDFDD